MEQNISAVWIRIRNDKVHSKKLQDIKNRSREFRSPSPETSKLLKHFRKCSAINKQQQLRLINQSNLRMLNRLKQVFFQSRALSPQLTRMPMPVHKKTLNSTLRRREADRVDSENQALAKRLEAQSSYVRQQRLVKEPQKAEKYIHTISKFNCLQSIQKAGKRIARSYQLKIGKQTFCNSVDKSDHKQGIYSITEELSPTDLSIVPEENDHFKQASLNQ